VARTWLKVELALVGHRKTKALARLWRCHPYMITGFMVSLWGYCLEFQSDGRLSDIPTEDLDELAAACIANVIGNVPSVVDSLVAVGFADEDSTLHDWQDYAGSLVTKRKKDRDRKRSVRGTKRGQVADISRTSAPRAEQSRVEQRIDAAAAPSFVGLCCAALNLAVSQKWPSVTMATTTHREALAGTAEAWERDGIPALFACAHLAEKVAGMNVRGNAPRSLKYFDRPLRDAFEQSTQQAPAGTLTPAEEVRAMRLKAEAEDAA
jgi:hypothetical protein